MNWQNQANEAIKNGYQPGNSWETLLRNSLMADRPELAKEMGNDLEAYLQVMTNNAMEFEETLLDQGTPPELARELTMQQLLNLAS